MGLSKSKGAVLTYEEARQRVGPECEQRLRDAFKRFANSHQLLHRVFFFREVLGDVVPERIAEEIFKAFGGSVNGVSFKDLVVGLALLTSGSLEEKAKFLFSVFSNDSDVIEKRFMDQLLIELDGKPGTEIDILFNARDRVTFEEFWSWIRHTPGSFSFSNWLMREKLQLTDNVETKTFYSTLDGVTHLNENEITQLEHRFWHLKPASGRIDTGVFHAKIGDLLPSRVIEGLFRAFDVNGDAQIDFKEMTCGVSACCRGPDNEREKFCFRIFDSTGDGRLDRESLKAMLREFERTWTVNDVCAEHVGYGKVAFPIEELLDTALPGAQAKITKDEYLIWRSEREDRKGLSAAFLDLLSQICHVIFGLPPKDKEEERRVVLHWLRREKKGGLLEKDRRFFLLSKDWWDRWTDYVSYKPGQRYRASAAHLADPGSAAEALTDPRHPVPGLRQLTNKSNSLSNLCDPEPRLSVIAGDRTPPGALTTSNSETFVRPGREARNGAKDRRRMVNAEDVPPKEPGPIDNGTLVTHFKNTPSATRLQTITDEGEIVRQNVREERDYVVLPEKLWECLFRRYNGGPTLPRMAVLSAGGDLELELHPIMVRILRHQTVPERGAGAGAGGKSSFVDPSSMRYLPQAGLFWSATGQSAAAASNGVVNSPRRKPIHTAFFSKVHTISQIYTFLGNKLRVPREEMRLWLYIEEARMTLLEDEELEFGRAADQVHRTNGLRDVVYDGRAQPLNLLLEVRNKDLTWPEEIYQLAKTGSLHSRRTSHVLGVTGLNNLGNTCFMNAAVQCVSNTGALSRYFKEDCYAYELNKYNPLGMKGHIARRYGELLLDMWSGRTCVVAPLKLRMTIARYSTQFSGNMQHDAHEFLAFLLDGLHEDLNRVMVKPYVELKDSDGRDDAIVAKEAWENHLLRNRSIVVDLFHGLLKSQVQCGTCSHVSVRFDPFSVLSLPLPMESSQPIDVIVSRLDESRPVRHRLLLNHDDRFRAVKVELARLYPGASADAILLAEVLNSQIRCFPRDGEKVNRLSTASVYAYLFPATPTPAPAPVPTEQDALSPPRNGQEDALSSSSSSTPTAPSTASAMVRNSSSSSLQQLGDGVCAFDCFVAYHRKMERNDVYFLAHMKARPRLFGLPIVVPQTCASCRDLYEAVWTQVKRLMGPKTNESLFFSNHATDCDDNVQHPFPFHLKIVDRMGMKCPSCQWYKLCRGCCLPCDDSPLAATRSMAQWAAGPGARFLAIDWEPTALHLRYQSSREYDFELHSSVAEAERRLTEPMDLRTCLDHFVQHEELDQEDSYLCSKCETHRRARKKLDLWQVPPILIIHLKRFHYVNNRWMKSHKIVNFPHRDLDLSEYIVSRPATASAVNGDEARNRNGPCRPQRVEEAEDALQNGDHGDMGDAAATPGPSAYKYKLYAITCHLGALGGGHYVSYARNPNQRWYRFNDSSTKEVDQSEIDVNSAYILFYERENSDWSKFMPATAGRDKVPVDEDDDIDSDIKKACCLQ